MLETSALIEELLSEHAEQFVHAVEERAYSDTSIAEAVAMMDVSEVAKSEADLVRAMQRRVRERLGTTAWEGFVPLEPP